jgi:hypothetical protein
MASPDLCAPCKYTGLAMHIALALPAPQGIGAPPLPGWTLPGKVGPVPMAGYSYTLRTVRAGYIYVYFEKNERGSKQWQVWDVSANGHMFLLPEPEWITPLATMSMKCTRTGHSAARLHCIVIENPDKCTTSWMAFSEHLWSKDTRERYAGDKALRSQRMVSFEPAALIGTDKPSGDCLTVGSQAAIEAICDYAPTFTSSWFPYEKAPHLIKSISTGDDGQFDKKTLQTIHSTRYPWADGRTGTADKAVEMLKLRSKKKDGTDHPGVVIALPDAIGCSHELNGFRNDVAGCITRYSQERGMQVTACNAFESLPHTLKQRALDQIEQVWQWSPGHSQRRLQGIKPSATAEERELEKDLCGRWEQDATARAPESLARQRSTNIARGRTAYMADQVRIDKGIAARQKNLNKNPSITQTRQAQANDWGQAQYEQCKARIDTVAMSTFKNNWNQFLAATNTEIDKRTVELIKWLTAPALLTALEDFHPTNPDDGVVFEDVIGNAIMGIGSTVSGATQIDAWVKEMQAKPSNLLWRAVAQNQTSGIQEINVALKQVYSAAQPIAATTWAGMAGSIKWNKVADLGKKSLTFYNTNQKAINDSKSGIKAIDQTRGLDKILSTTGHRLLKPLASAGDTINAVLLQTVLAVRAGAEPAKALALADAQIKHLIPERDDLIHRIKSNDHNITDAAKARQQELSKRWRDLRVSADVADAHKGNYNAARDARLALVVALFEAFNLYNTQKKLGDDPQNDKVKMQLTAAMLGTASAVVDVASTWVKGIDELKDKGANFQKLKLLGGSLSVAATVYGAVVDLKTFLKEESNAAQKGDGNYQLATLYGVRFIFQGASAVLTGLTTLSYLSPSLEAFGERYAARFAGQAATRIAGWAVAQRAALMLASIEVSIFVMAVSMLIGAFEPNALQVWCTNSAFGKDRKKSKEAYVNTDQQEYGFMQAFSEAT